MLDFNFLSILDRVLLPTSTLGPLKIIVFPMEKQGIFKKSSLEDNIDFCSILEANMPPCCFLNPSKSLKNPILRGMKILMVCCFDFSSILAPFWEPSWSHVGHQDAPKTPLGRAWGAPGGQQDNPRGPKKPES